jgi:hypothetical protein
LYAHCGSLGRVYTSWHFILAWGSFWVSRGQRHLPRRRPRCTTWLPRAQQANPWEGNDS